MAQIKGNERLQGTNKAVSQIGLFLLLIGYWYFARQLEQVDLRGSTLAWVQGLVAFFDFFPLSNAWIWLAEFFTWRVLRHLIPFFIGLWLAQQAVLGMMQSFYDLEDKETAGRLLQRLSSSYLGFGRPTLIDPVTFGEARKKDPLLKIGGPGRIMVASGSVLVTEKDGKFCRVLGSGRHILGRFEKPRSSIDLRPHEKEAEGIKLMTNDGIELRASLTITFQILRGNEKPTRSNPFPYDKEAVRKAAYTETNEPNGNIGLWDGMPMLITSAQLRRVVSEYSIDELIVSDPNGIDIHRRLQLEMERRAKNILQNYGIWIRGTRLGALELPDVVEEQRKKFWKTNWSTQQLLKRADGESEVLQSREIARAEAEAIMLRAIAEGLQRSQLSGKSVSSKEVVALRLIESLEEIARNSEETLSQSSQLIPQLGALRQQLMLTSGQAEEAESQE